MPSPVSPLVARLQAVAELEARQDDVLRELELLEHKIAQVLRAFGGVPVAGVASVVGELTLAPREAIGLDARQPAADATAVDSQRAA